jgi:uncharacterized protein
MGVGGRIGSVDELRSLYREPHRVVRSKIRPELDELSRAFIERSPFLLIATVGVDGRVDVSPRGGPPGFVRVLPDGSVAVPDLNGNNLIDTLRAVVETGRAGMIVVHPGRDETLRVNGAAHVSVDPELLAGFTAELRTPKSAIVVEPQEVFIHCAKAFRRGRVWDAASWPAFADSPDAVDILRCQLGLEGDAEEMRAGMAESYASDLAQD